MAECAVVGEKQKDRLSLFFFRYRQRSWCRRVFRLRTTGATGITSLSAVNDFYSCILASVLGFHAPSFSVPAGASAEGPGSRRRPGPRDSGRARLLRNYCTAIPSPRRGELHRKTGHACDGVHDPQQGHVTRHFWSVVYCTTCRNFVPLKKWASTLAMGILPLAEVGPGSLEPGRSRSRDAE